MDGPGLLISGGIALTLASEPGPSLSTGWWPQYAVRYEGNWRHQTIAGFCYQGGFRLRRHLRVAATSVRRPSSTGRPGRLLAQRMRPSGVSGSERMRRPPAAWMALAIAGAMAMIGVSPAPAEGRSGRSSTVTSIGGTSANRGTR